MNTVTQVAALPLFALLWDGAAVRAETRIVPSVEYPNIAAAIQACAVYGDEVVVLDGAYTGDGFRDLDFQGKAILLHSASDHPSACTIDCGAEPVHPHRAFWFHSGESAGSVVRGFTIKGGCVVSPPLASGHGGAILCEGGSSPKIANCRFEGNQALGLPSARGGAIACEERSSPVISHCVFVTNKALGDAGCGGAISCFGWSSPTITYCTIQDNEGGSNGGAIYCETARPIIAHCQIRQNKAAWQWHGYGYAVHCVAASPAILNCLIEKNENAEPYHGGGVGCFPDSTGQIGSSPLITNCTIADNTTYQGNAGGLYCEGDSQPVVTNCILWGNSTAQNQQITAGSVNPIVTYSDVQGASAPPPPPWYGFGCIDADPQFVTILEPSAFAGAYYLDVDSPCVDAGNELAAKLGFGASTTQLSLAPDSDKVDMGYHYGADCQGNQIPDPLDILKCPALDPDCADCNYNGVPDWCDINVYYTSLDEYPPGGNDVPDECEGGPHKASFTLSTDFGKGTLINVNHTVEPDQLQRNERARPLDYLWVPATGRGSVVRIYTGNDVDIAYPGQVLGEYYTAPQPEPGVPPSGAPSRTAVDLDGSLWVTNKNATPGSTTKVGLIIGGTRCDATGTPNPYGQYLKPPFKYNTCVDRDGDGLIRTSRALLNVLAWPEGAANLVDYAEDECICKYLELEDIPGARFTAVTRDNDVWIGGTGLYFQRFDSETGELEQQITNEHGGYGGLVSIVGGEHVIWSSGRDGSVQSAPLLRLPTRHPGSATQIGADSYGVGIDRDGNIWTTLAANNTISKLDPATGEPLIEPLPSTGGNEPTGVTATLPDGASFVWVANRGNDRVTKLDVGTGGLLETIQLDQGTGPTAVAVDGNGYVWVVKKGSHAVSCIIPGDPSVVDPEREVWLDSSASPYAYSDMTGQVTSHASGVGTWNVVHDSGHLGAEWHLAVWNTEDCPDSLPQDTVLTVELRAADLQAALTSQPWRGVENMCWFDGVQGRFVEIRVRFKGTCPGAPFIRTPVVCDLIAYNGLADCNCDGAVNAFDTDPFILALTNPTGYQEQYPGCNVLTADCDCNGTVDAFDVDPFARCLSNDGCACGGWRP